GCARRRFRWCGWEEAGGTAVQLFEGGGVGAGGEDAGEAGLAADEDGGAAVAVGDAVVGGEVVERGGTEGFRAVELDQLDDAPAGLGWIVAGGRRGWRRRRCSGPADGTAGCQRMPRFLPASLNSQSVVTPAGRVRSGGCR